MSDTALRSDDLEPTDLGMTDPVDPEAPKGRKADGTPRRRRATSVDPSEINGDEDRQQTQKETRAAVKKLKEEKARAEAVAQVHEMVDAKINPMLAVASRMILQVPKEIDVWMDVEKDEEGAIKLDRRGVPKYQYSPAAQMCILQPFEVEILTMVAPAAMNAEATEKIREFGQKAAPFLAVGAAAAFAGSYYLRLKEVGKALEVQKIEYNARLQAATDQAARQAEADGVA